MKHIYICTLLWIGSIPAFSQHEIVKKYAESITQKDLKGLLTIIASDAMEGRETGSRGQKMAAVFIQEEFKRIGLEPIVPVSDGNSFLQKFNLENYAEESIYLGVDEFKYSLKSNILFTGRNEMSEPRTGEVVFIPSSELKDLSKLDLDNKTAVIASTGSTKAELKVLARMAYKANAKMVVLIPFKTDKDFTLYKRSEGRSYAKTKNSFEQFYDETMPGGYFLVSPTVAGSILNVEEEVLKGLLEESASKKVVSKINSNDKRLTYFTSLPNKVISTENVMGFLEGSDKKDELVIITAHYDHIGRRGDKINNGADDDGSGTSAVIEIAEAYSLAKEAGHGPRRSILFMTVTGEEKGLIGSQYYTNNPILPLENTVVDLNIDMVGRSDKAHEFDREFVYLVGSDRLSSELHELSEKANTTFTNLSLDYTYNDENHPDRIYYRSDHWNFAKHNVPIIFYFNGVHDDYHRPSDTVDKIEFDLLQKRTQLVFYTSWVIANRDQKLVVDKLQNTQIKSK